MIDRIIESFTKPKMEITAIDEFIQSISIIGFVFLIIIVLILISVFMEDR